MRIAMIGTGYVGLVSGACFSDFGHDVICVDKDAGKIAALEAGKMPIFEPGLDTLVATNVAAGRLSFTTDLKTAVSGADAVFIAVGTPSRRGDGKLRGPQSERKRRLAQILGRSVISSTIQIFTAFRPRHRVSLVMLKVLS